MTSLTVCGRLCTVSSSVLGRQGRGQGGGGHRMDFFLVRVALAWVDDVPRGRWGRAVSGPW
ncbi:hypothetical protein [Streptomyces carpinensis]|uniref:Uncharacterized protein n=1 Tax=Streptomyces carpinensis TaxID=66369 RepID=A0ABV1WHN2_9ACTN|nr:hypothetical protein [Streptomyces carpinensis]